MSNRANHQLLFITEVQARALGNIGWRATDIGDPEATPWLTPPKGFVSFDYPGVVE